MSFRTIFNRSIEDAVEGRNMGIPMPTEKLQKAFSGITPATYYLGMAESNTGKTRIIYSLFWLHPLEFVRKDTLRKPGDVTVFLYALEMPLDKTLAITSARWLHYHKLTAYSDSDIMGITEKPSKELVEHTQNTELLEYLDYLDANTKFRTENDPKRILDELFEYCKENSEQIGVNDKGQPIYRFLNRNKMVIVILDHLGNVSSPGKGYRETINYLSKGFLKLRNMFGITIVAIQQSNPGEEQPVLIPGHRQTRDSKDPFIDCDTAFGIGNPFKLELTEVKYKKGVYYVIPTPENQNRGVKNRLRLIGTSKVRYGDLTLRLPLYFHGAYCRIEDMPPPEKINYATFK